MSGEYIEKTNIGDSTGKKVFIVKGGWSCNAGYVVWSYVAEDTGIEASYAKTQYDKCIAKIGKRLFEPVNRLGSMYKGELLNKCIQFVKDNKYFCDMIITMKTD